ncbi:hypothetical protein [Cupriavidus metallidurans]|uniref:gp53-like domain-containing protein n=1 Tax=Cupriavidus metallidurans TaxID=119219 RepID=UPI002E2EEB50|nr:hypothetical protein [Cupriavidus metallidurans]
MPGNIIKLTDAGRAAFVGPGNTGTVKRTITKIGVATAPFVHKPSLAALPNERKKLDTFGGENVAPDTIHVTLRDDSEDLYTLYGFGLYLDNGVLLGTYSQDTPILEKSPQAMLLLSADMRFAEIDAALIQFGSSEWTNPPATEERQGVVELATAGETQAGTDTLRAVTPAGLSSRTATEVRTGLAAIATQPEVNAGADDSKFVSPRKLAVALSPKAPKDSPAFSGVADYSAGVPWTNAGWKRAVRFGDGNAIMFDAGVRKYGLGAAASDGRLYFWWSASADDKAASNYYQYVDQDGTVNFALRPKFAGATPWDTGNLNPALLAPLDSPFFIGTPKAPTAQPGSNDELIANTAFVAAAIAALVNSAPGSLDTLRELADAIGDDPNFATTVFNLIATKAPLLSPALTGTPTATTPPQFDNSQRIVTSTFLRKFGKQFSIVQAFTGALTGNATHIGGMVYGHSATSNSYSIPDSKANALPDGVTVTVSNFGEQPLLVVPQANDKVQTPDMLATAAFSVPSGTSAEFTLVVGGVWFITGTAVNGSSAQFASSPYHQKLPSGLIEQWGLVQVPENGSVVVTLPTSYTSGVYCAFSGSAQAEMINTSTPGCGVTVLSLSQIKIQNTYTMSPLWMYWRTTGK